MFDLELTGDKQLIAALGELRESTARGAVRRAASKALTPINREAKKLTPKDHGLLKKAIGKVLKTYKRDGTVWGSVGVRKGFGQTIDGEKHEPRNYAHLVELGTRNHPGAHMIGKAYASKKDEALRIFETELKAELEKARLKALAKSKGAK